MPMSSTRLADLAERPVRLYLVGRLGSHTGNGAHTIAVTALVWDLTGSGTAVGTVATAQFLPQLVGAPFAGALVDRVDRRRAMLVQQTVALTLAATMATLTLTGFVSVWIVYLVTLGVGISTAVSNPVQQGLLNEMTTASARQPAVALNAVTLQVGTLAGAGAAGLLLPVAGPGVVMLASPATYTIALVLLVRIRPDMLTAPDPATDRSAAAPVREGLAHVAATPELRAATASSAAVGLLGMGAIGVGAQALILTTAEHVADGTLLAWVAGATAIGGIAALLHVTGAPTPSTRTLVTHVAGLAIAVAGAAVAPGLVLILVAVGAAAWAAHAHQALAQTMLHRAPAHFVGRVSGIWFACASGPKAAAGPLAGLLADLLGPRAGLGVAAGLLVFTAAGVATLHRTPTRSPRTEDFPSQSAQPVRRF